MLQLCHFHVSLDEPVVSLRLVNGSDETSGRVEIYHEGEWFTVCDNNFGIEEAQVICKSLGYG